MHALVRSEVGRRGKVQTVHHGVVEEHCVGVHVNAEELGGFQRELHRSSASPLMQFVFGNGPKLPESIRWPVTSITSEGPGAVGCATQVIAVRGPTIRNIRDAGGIVGRVYADDNAEYCYLGGISPVDLTRSRETQARSVFERIESALAQVDMNFTHVTRTWLYLDRLLDWYGEFNAVRTTFFRERGVFNKMVPASTGIGAANPRGAALMAGAIAIKPKSDRTRIFAVQSPLQCPAIDYRSSFSRAVEIVRSGGRQLWISGTASIASDGTSAHVGDIDRQIELTMKVIHAILHSRKMDWQHTTRAIAYFTNATDIPLFQTWCKRHGLRDFPVVYVPSTVCREELLFEVELDAAGI
jgi:enamine deaminase RidA (YjgF/YER057c/UK114 family)